MTNRDDLIEEVARMIADFAAYDGPVDAFQTAKVLVGMFEKASAPTDDAREALAAAVLEASVWPEKPMRAPGGSEFAFVDRLLASGAWGFRRPSPPETGTERNAIETIKLRGHLAAETMHFAGSDYPVKAITYTNFLSILGDALDESSDPEPQGEPSDAQVLAALNACYPYSVTATLSDYHPITADGMRAALRAAAVVTDQGEAERRRADERN